MNERATGLYRNIRCGLWRAILVLGFFAGSNAALAQSAPGQAGSAADLNGPISGDEAVADFDAWLNWTLSTHPDVSYTVDPAELETQADDVRTRLADVTTLRDAWATMAELNPIFDDAHTGLRLPENHFEEWIDRGGLPFPEPVIVREGKAYLASSGAEIISINGIATAEALQWLMPRLRGEDDLIRERIASLRFPLALWTYSGGSERYEVELQSSDGARETHVFDSDDDQAASLPEEDVFRLAFEDEFAVLTPDTFDRERQVEFEAFLIDAFDRIAGAGAQQLIIDLRQNGGGARDLSDLLMAYLTDQPYSPISAVTARIVPENQRLIPTAALGDVVRVPFAQTVTPASELTNRFGGNVWILIGPQTYSQAIAFAATVQDHGVARLAGSPTSGRANQTGQVQRHNLAQTGFNVQSPIYIFVRKSGDRSAAPLIPDVELNLEPGSDIGSAIEQLGAHTQ